ncbi:MAG TPA: hypothetical protein VHT92_09945 [Candidatus Cybelea sp.]|jgi:hypothetical protein|nr:hypothetical protein [Candidatus Cybelea sp.]
MRIGFLAFAVALSACASAAPAPEQFAGAPLALSAPVQAFHPDHGRSRIVADGGQSLLYVSDTGPSDVYIYTWPGGKQTGKLTGLASPTGVCNDSSGNIWVVESRAAEVVKFAHGGTKKLATVSAPYAQRLTGCAVDPTTGNLAVADIGGAAGSGGIYVWAKAQGKATEYSSSQILEAFFCGYDASGNLFCDGVNKSYAFTLVELASGASKLQVVQTNGAIAYPGGVAWDGQYLAVGDQAYQNGHESAVYQLTISGSNATVHGTTVLDGSCDALQFAIKGGNLAAPDACKNNAKFYKYPAGGSATVTLSGFQYPVAAAVSIKK